MEWTAEAWMAGLMTRLRAREALSGVQLLSAAPTAESLEDRSIYLIDVTAGDDQAHSIGPQSSSRVREEEYTVNGAVVARSMGGKSVESDIVEARTAVFGLYRELYTQLRATPDMGVSTDDAQIIDLTLSRSLEQGIEDKYRVAVVRFGVTVTARI